MLVSATRTVSALTLRALLYGGLFVLVVIVHVAFTSALRQAGWNGGTSLFVSGVVVLGLVLVFVNSADWVRERRAASRELQRMREGLPGGPCCVVWRGGGESDEDMPWDVVGPLRARYPQLARRLGVEGVAVVDFEISAEGKAKNIHLVEVWPSEVFYKAACEALQHARFTPKPDTHVRFGASYKIPFVFRIAGASQRSDAGRRARPLRPALQAVEKAASKRLSDLLTR